MERSIVPFAFNLSLIALAAGMIVMALNLLLFI